MSWGDVDAASVEIDEWDPTRPQMRSHEPGDPDPAEDPLLGAARPLVSDDGEIDFDRGFVDSRDVLRVWADDDGLITKVRVSTQWRERLARTGTGTEAELLAQAFDQVLTAINATRPRRLPHQPDDSETDTDEVLTWEALDRIRTESDRLQAELDAVPDGEGFGHWQGTPVSGFGADGNVRIDLNAHGDYEGIAFHPLWLRQSRVGLICNAVPEAAHAARAQHVPPVYVPGPHDHLQRQAAALRAQLSAMMKRGFDR